MKESSTSQDTMSSLPSTSELPVPEKLSTDIERSLPPLKPLEPPNGGLQAWLAVLGGFCLAFASFGWINCTFDLPLHSLLKDHHVPLSSLSLIVPSSHLLIKSTTRHRHISILLRNKPTIHILGQHSRMDTFDGIVFHVLLRTFTT